MDLATAIFYFLLTLLSPVIILLGLYLLMVLIAIIDITLEKTTSWRGNN